MRLQTRYALVMATLVAIVVLCLSATLLIQFRASYAQQTQISTDSMAEEALKIMHQRGTYMANYLADALINAVYREEHQEIYQLLKPGLEQDDLLFIQVFDPQGNIIHDGTKEVWAYGDPIGDEEALYAVLLSEQLFSRQDKELIVFARSLKIGDELLGGIRLGYSLQALNEDVTNIEHSLQELRSMALQRSVYSVIVSVMLLIVLGVVMAMLVARSLVKPISLLSRFADQMRSGNYDVDIDIQRADELGELADAFSQMNISLRKSTNEIRHIAFHDSLTGLPNRHMLRGHLDRSVAYAKRHEQQLALMFLDLDGFKRVNDTLGHDVGDQLLVKVAKRLRSVLRTEDFISANPELAEQSTIARLGGDEFTVVLNNVRDSLDAALVAERILDVLSTPFSLAEHQAVISCSIGITVFPQDGDSTDSLLKNADLAMYSAKEAGKGQFHYFTEEMNTGVHEKLAIEADLRQALVRDEFRLHYQPQVDTQTGKLRGAEALIRWLHPTRGMVSPFEFIPVAEQTGLIDAIGDWILRQACTDAGRLSRLYGDQFWVAVNVSSIQFRQKELADRIAQIMDECGTSPQQLHVELTETSLIANEQQTAATLTRLREMGIKVWMDDFGTGYSSLSHLQLFPLDGVKVDRSFVRDILTEPSDLALTNAIIAMARNLGLYVVAEGVENTEQLELLSVQQCDISQGYLFSQPLPVEHFEQRIKSDTYQQVSLLSA